MKKNIFQFESTGELISHLSKNDKIVGIVEYGTRQMNDMSNGGDYDLSIFIDGFVSTNINGVHFHIASIPVDCMILDITEIEKDKPANQMMLAHIDSRILYDKNGRVKKGIEKIREKWEKIGKLEDWEINFYRFFFKHTIDKIGKRLNENPMFSNYSISLAEISLLDAYERINQLEPGKPRKVIEYIFNNNKKLYRLIECIQNGNSISCRYDALVEASETVLEKYNGVWKDDEMIFHLKYNGKNDSNEQEKIIHEIFEIINK